MVMNATGEKDGQARCKCRCPKGRETGFTYLGLLAVIAAMGVLFAGAAQVWHVAMKREKEQELLFVGSQFREAIKRYYDNSPALSRRYPSTLEELLSDPRYPSTQRYLRKIYADPVSGNANWGLVKGPSGEILGVYSLSEDEPIKKSNFSSSDKGFEGRMRYADWKFMYVQGQSSAGPLRRR
jgi:type II secretory pathway pseudopilin PulG